MCSDKDSPGLVPVVAIQSIRRQPAPVAMDEPGISFLRNGLLANTKKKFHMQLMTDATIVVGHRSWGVHRADLSMESPLFRTAFECQPNQGTLKP